MLKIFDNIIAHIISNKKPNQIETEIKKKLNIFTTFITETILPVSKNVKLNYTNVFIVKISSKQEVTKKWI